MAIIAGDNVLVYPYVGEEQEHISLHGQIIKVGDNVLVSRADEYHITAPGFLSGWTKRKRLIITLPDSLETDYPYLIENIDISNFTFNNARDFRVTKLHGRDPPIILLDYWTEPNISGATANIWVKMHKVGSSVLTGDSGTDNILDVNDGTVFAVDDYVVIKDDAHPDGEVNKITGISTNQLTFENNFAISYTAAQNAKVCHAAYVYYKNPSASDASNGENVWNLLFDNFSIEGFLDSDKWEEFGDPNPTTTVQDGYVKVRSASAASKQIGLRSIIEIGDSYRLVMRLKFDSLHWGSIYNFWNAVGQSLDASNLNSVFFWNDQYGAHPPFVRHASRAEGIWSFAEYQQNDTLWHRYLNKKLGTSHHKAKQDAESELELTSNIYSGNAPFRILHQHDNTYLTTHTTYLDYVGITDKYVVPEPTSFLGSEEEGESVTTIEKKHVVVKSESIHNNFEVAILRLANLCGINKTAFTELEYSTRGYVLDSAGAPITGHSVFLTGDKVSTVLTDENGLYIFPDLQIDKNYEVTLDKEWYFSPQKYTYSPLGESKTSQNFIRGKTFYQTTRIERHPALWAWGNYWPGAGSFPIPGEDHVQKVRFGAIVTLVEGTESPHLIGFSGIIHGYGTLWGIGGFSSVPETKHVEVFFLDYDPSMTPHGFYVSYWVNDQWHGYDDKNWDFHGEIEFIYEESPPSVETLEATDITDTTVTINGKLNEVGWEECIVWFEWGLTEAYGSETTHESFSLKWNFSAPLTGLVSGELYHFRAVVQSGGVTYYGDDKTFTTT